MQGFPKIIWMVWLQGWDQAPRLVRTCRRSWEVNNPDWTIRCLDRNSVIPFIEDCVSRTAIDDLDQPAEACSNRIRVALLEQHGGVWADATTYCLRPLNDWLFGVLRCGFFAFENPLPDRLLSSWFLAANPGNYVVQRWSELTVEYWRGRSQRHTYFWFHYLFGDEYKVNPVFRSIWDDVPKRSAAGPAYYLPRNAPLFLPLTERDREVISADHAPLLKLYHRLPPGAYPANSVAEFLCQNLGA
jgi:hypothetical protein